MASARRNIAVLTSEEAQEWHVGHWRWLKTYLRENKESILGGTDARFFKPTLAEFKAAQLLVDVKIVKWSKPDFKI